MGAGAGLERLRQLFFTQIPEMPVFEETAEKPERVFVKDERAEYEAERLRRQVENLQRSLALQQRAVPETLAPELLEVVDDTAARRGAGGAGGGRRGQQGQLELTPEQLEEMRASREEFQQRREQLAADRINYLTSFDVKAMTPAQRENHEKLLASLTRMNELSASLTSDFGMGGSEEARLEMRELSSELGVLYERERRYLLEGVVGTTVADQIQEIFDNTSMPRGMMFGGGAGSILGVGGNNAGGRAGQAGGGRGGNNAGGRGGGGR